MQVAMESWSKAVLCYYFATHAMETESGVPNLHAFARESLNTIGGAGVPFLSMTGRVQQDCGEEFMPDLSPGRFDSVARTSEAETCSKRGPEARVKKKSIMRMVRYTLMKGVARWRG